MRAIVLEGFGGPEKLVIKEMPKPEAKPGQVLIAVRAFGVNHAETHMRKGEWAEYMPIIGIECVGGLLTQLAAWLIEREIAFYVTSIGMIVMLLWAGSYKMTVPGAEGIIPLVSNSPLISWHFKIFGPYIGSDIIGMTEITAALLFLIGYLKPKAGILGGLIASLMFFITSTMLLTTPGAIISVPGIHGMRYMSFLGLFLYKDILAFGVAIYLIGYFGTRARVAERTEPSDDQSR